MLTKILFIVGLVSAGLLLILMNTTTPSTVGAFGIFCVFLLAYITTTCFLTVIFWILIRFSRRFKVRTRTHGRISNMKFSEVYYYATVIAFAPIILVSLQSVDGVNLYELGLVAVLVILGCIYVFKRKS